MWRQRQQLLSFANAVVARQASRRPRVLDPNYALVPFPSPTLRSRRTFSSSPAPADDHQPDHDAAAVHPMDVDEETACPVWMKKLKAPPPTTTTYFQVFDLEPRYSIALDKLQQRYKKLMIEHHPDKHQRSSAERQQESDEQSAIITRAYETLRNPQSRALHLLDVLGHPLDESATSHLVGQDFLMNVMEVREEILDHEGDDQALIPLWQANQERIQALTRQLAQAFDEHNPPDVERALRLTAMLQYWYRVEEKLFESMEEIPESRSM